MPSFNNIFAVAGLAALASAQTYTPPNPQRQTWGPVNSPSVGSPVTRGVPYTVTWDPENRPVDGVTISLVLCKGPSTNCVTEPTAIATGLAAAAKSYTWNVPCSLTPGEANTATGYGLLAIVDGSGEFQYSTQFSVLAGSCDGTSTTPVPTISLPTASATTISDDFSFTFDDPTTTSSTTWGGWTKTFTTSAGTTTSKPSNGTTTSYGASSTTAAYTTTGAAGTTPAQPTFTGAANKLAGAGAAILAAGAALLAL